MDIYKRYGYKNENEIKSFSAKLCNADLAIPWHINHEENNFGMEGVEKYKVDEMKEFVRLWEIWDKQNFYSKTKTKILDVMTIIMFIEFVVRIVLRIISK